MTGHQHRWERCNNRDALVCEDCGHWIAGETLAACPNHAKDPFRTHVIDGVERMWRAPHMPCVLCEPHALPPEAWR